MKKKLVDKELQRVELEIIKERVRKVVKPSSIVEQANPNLIPLPLTQHLSS